MTKQDLIDFVNSLPDDPNETGEPNLGLVDKEKPSETDNNGGERVIEPSTIEGETQVESAEEPRDLEKVTPESAILQTTESGLPSLVAKVTELEIALANLAQEVVRLKGQFTIIEESVDKTPILQPGNISDLSTLINQIV